MLNLSSEWGGQLKNLIPRSHSWLYTLEAREQKKTTSLLQFKENCIKTSYNDTRFLYISIKEHLRNIMLFSGPIPTLKQFLLLRWILDTWPPSSCDMSSRRNNRRSKDGYKFIIKRNSKECKLQDLHNFTMFSTTNKAILYIYIIYIIIIQHLYMHHFSPGIQRHYTKVNHWRDGF